ncbi:MAG: four helix bundle protein [Candidatus Thiodiazotropha sp. (ex Epidulcina cf. delphinae)]|nr:four helix bundle protein [Candidatus Thiodiazotropha sp. (ex Epidulcina cf. delphinae)]MCU7919491.1 four helix bundle protein [Candidatus Thiodiazotropha sp. (ex Epidulcina cf. delphinae)]MCU7919492.1 four helix bundle protein [Candidatus Thiodiazotropha sp. (ex Epidulcina cf. delphinae)]
MGTTGNVVRDKSFRFAVRIVNAARYLQQNHREFVLSKQLLRSGTSIGANIEEAMAGQSRKDFIAKMAIASKETRETHYWIRLLISTGYLNDGREAEKTLINDCIELSKMLTSIVKTSQEN